VSTGPSVVILLPGLGGSELRALSGDNIWPGSLLDYHNYPEAKLELLIGDGTLLATDLIRKVFVCPVYQTLIDFLGTLGYREAASGTRPKNLYLFPYDWRQDLLKTTGLLAQLVVSVFNTFHHNCAITLLAHSTGGMISRCLLESGRFDSILGSARGAVSQLITMGTASRGAPEALAGILGIAGLLSLTPAQAKRLAAAPNYPSAYQHMPAPRTAALWNAAAPNLPVDLYDASVGARLGLLPNHVRAAIDFWSTLVWPLFPFKPPRYFGFVGTHKTTLEGFLYDGSASGSAAVTKIEIDDGGDDTVPIWSADLPGLQVQYVGGSHPFLFQDSGLLSRLAELLPPGSSAVSVAAVQGPLTSAIDASVAGLVLRKGGRQPQEVVVKLSIGPHTVAKGELVIEHRPLPAGGAKFDGAKWLRSPQSVRHVRVDLPPRGPRHYPVAIGALGDLASGYYNVFFRRAGEKKAAGQSAPFIVPSETAAGPPPRGAGPRKKKKAVKKKYR
jgi:phospholipase A1